MERELRNSSVSKYLLLQFELKRCVTNTYNTRRFDEQERVINYNVQWNIICTLCKNHISHLMICDVPKAFFTCSEFLKMNTQQSSWMRAPRLTNSSNRNELSNCVIICSFMLNTVLTYLKYTNSETANRRLHTIQE